jgi:hypothetical protein
VDVRWNGFSWSVHADDRLPSAAEVDTTELTLGPLATTTVELARRGRGTKFHTVSDLHGIRGLLLIEASLPKFEIAGEPRSNRDARREEDP